MTCLRALYSPLRMAMLASAAICAFCSPVDATVIYSDDFSDNDASDWTFLNRNGVTEIADPSWAADGSGLGSAGQLAQSTTNYDFPRDAENDPVLGAIALSASGNVGGIYSISVDMTSLEPGNGFQDQDIVFAYTDADNFYLVETIASGGANLFSVIDGNRMSVGGAGISFSHSTTNVVLTVDTAAGDVSINYGGAGDASLGTGLALTAGLNGVGSNNDAFAIDNYVVSRVPEPTSLVLLALGSGFAAALARRRQ